MEDIKVYMVVNLKVEDKETYLKYEKGFFPSSKDTVVNFLLMMTHLGIWKVASLYLAGGLSFFLSF